jgi:group I intron endonuclease
MMGTAFLGYIIISPKWLEIYNNEYLIVTSALLPLTPSLKLQEILSKNNLKPLRTWENLHQDGVKKAVQTRVKDIMGIYAIVNLVTGDLYVGSAVKGRMRNRFHKHLFGGTGSIITYAAVLKYGLSNFAFVILESVEGSVNDDNNKELLMREDYYLSTLLPMYNIAPKVGNTLGVKHTNETKHKMKINYSSERREAIGALNRGKTLTPETVEAIRQAALNRAPISDETRKNFSSKLGKVYLISRVDNYPFLSPNDTMASSVTFQTLNRVRGFLNCDEKTVRRALIINNIVKKNWIVKVMD